MIVLIDEREFVIDSYKSQLSREGFASVGFSGSDFREWADTSRGLDLEAIGACLVGTDNTLNLTPRYLRQKTDAPVIALVETCSLENTDVLPVFGSPRAGTFGGVISCGGCRR